MSKTIEETKLELWQFCIEGGWVARPFNCLYSESTSGERVRLNFRSDDKLLLQMKKKGTWITMQEGSYTKIEIGEGKLVFPTKKRRRKPTQKSKRKEND